MTLDKEQSALLSSKSQGGRIKAVFFDVDGVILNSLPQHLKICADLAEEYQLGISIPSVEAFRRLIDSGTPISPMRRFFQAVGFPDNRLDEAVSYYQAHFAEHYTAPLFDGIHQAVTQLNSAGVSLGFVTANVQANIDSAFGDLLTLFPPSTRFYFNPDAPTLGKPDQLIAGATALGVEPEYCLYVGDQPADAQAADKAGFDFLAVRYGWGFLSPDSTRQSVDAPGQVAEFILQRFTKENEKDVSLLAK